ncbi:MAG: hypothetical protein BWY72_00458 [Bacteroidetes bacterium ADurb.Bin416]|nr:MAG: hypothetical protein BWY72_00458 [Bacteroidetes bacterium ADurb.Bin416]
MDQRGGQYAGQNGSDDTADAVHTKSIQGVIVAQFGLDEGHHEEAYQGNDHSDDQGAADTDKTSCRCDGNQAGYRSCTDTHNRGFAAVYPVQQCPRKRGYGC